MSRIFESNPAIQLRNLGLALTSLLSLIIKAYQILFRGLLPFSCRYAMSCSDFSLWAIRSFGLKVGSKHAIQRIFSCHPFWPAKEGV